MWFSVCLVGPDDSVELGSLANRSLFPQLQFRGNNAMPQTCFGIQVVPRNTFQLQTTRIVFVLPFYHFFVVSLVIAVLLVSLKVACRNLASSSSCRFIVVVGVYLFRVYCVSFPLVNGECQLVTYLIALNVRVCVRAQQCVVNPDLEPSSSRSMCLLSNN